MVSAGPVITVVSRARTLPPTVASRPPVELLRRTNGQLHGVHEGRHDGLVLGGAGGLGGRWRGLGLVRLGREVVLPTVCLCLEATRSACSSLAPASKCLRSEVGSRTIGRVLTVGRGQVRAVYHGVPGSLAPDRDIPRQAGELLTEQWRLLVQEILLSYFLAGAGP